jgi:hypothetical protein
MNDTELHELLDTWKAPAAPASLRAGLRSRLAARKARTSIRVPVRWLAAFSLAAGALAFGASLLWNGALSSEAGRWSPGIYVRRTRMVQPPVAKLKWMFTGGRSTGWEWREGKLVGSFYLYDRLSRKHYGYSWNAQPAAAREFLFTVQPLDPSVVREDGPIVPPPHLPAPRMIAAGSVFDVDLYESGSERVYDHIELSGEPFEIATHPEPAQAAATLTLSNPRLYINGQFAAGAGGVVRAAGLTAIVAVPGRGHYDLALDPKENLRFVRAGSANGNTIEFQSGGDRFRLECSAPVAPGGARPIFVFFESNPRESGPGFSSGDAPGQYR